MCIVDPHQVGDTTTFLILCSILWIDKGSPGGTLHSGTCIYKYGSYDDTLYM